MKIELVMWALPVVFMFHEYEEIIMFKQWLGDNKKELSKRFPRIYRFFEQHGAFSYSTATFALGTAHEFLLISLISYYSVCFEAYHWWFAALVGYFIHLFVHVVQWAIYRKYIPAIVTSILTLPYCIYAFVAFSKVSYLTLWQYLLWALVGLVLTLFSLFFAYWFMDMFQKWQTNSRR